MNKPLGGLGRGLGALIPQKIAPMPNTVEAEEAKGLRILEVPPSAIVPNPHQPRKHFAPSELAEMVASVKEHGVLQPLVVTDLGGGRYELIAGERRLRSSLEAGLASVPVVVREATQPQKLVLALIENIQRHDLNAIEEAQAYQSLADLFGFELYQIAEKMGKSRDHVRATLGLLSLEPEIQEAVMEGRLKRSHARALVNEKNPERRVALFHEILNDGLSINEVKSRAGHFIPKPPADRHPTILSMEAELRDHFGTKAVIKMKETSGTVTLHFYSKQDLKYLLERLLKS